ncbi:MAG TPA: diacylglycerol kinase family protein [Streptosporangiaceae bacterium]|nr:diacylglycerol kinase family protein [Streptosporangiaceae bacterium]
MAGSTRLASRMSADRQRPSLPERAGAIVSMLCLALALLVLALNAVLRIAAVVLALAGLLACVTACWYVVARRGAVRFLASLAALIALGAFIAGLVLTVISGWIVLAVAALGVISVLSARYALGRTPKAIRSAGRSARAKVAKAKAKVAGLDGTAPVLIMNLKSGGGKAEQFRLADECVARGIRPVILQRGDDLVALAEEAVAGGASAIGMAGGDGSQAAVASVAARLQVPFVCVPAGTRNHFALDLGLDRSDVVGALDAYADQIERQVDLAEVNGHTFVNNCSLGLYAKVVQSPEYRDAKIRTAAEMLPDLIGPDAASLDLSFAVPDGEALTTAHLILVSNNPYQLAHPGGRGTRERLDLGKLGVVAVQVSDAADARNFMMLELAGQVQRFAGWQEWTTEEFTVSSGGPIEVGIDGEAMVLEPPLRFATKPGALGVWLPKHALRVSPAARAVRLLARSTAADLVSVAAGSQPARIA